MYRCHNEFCKCYAVTLPNTPSAGEKMIEILIRLISGVSAPA